jgi:hypothetical protein
MSALDTKCSLLHCKKRLAIIPTPAGMSLAKLSQAENNRENLVSDITAGDGKISLSFFTV